jgi:hypothetical protein
MTKKLSDAMKNFAERKYLSRKGLVHYHEDDFWPFIHIENPTVLARFAAHIKQTVYRKNNGWVYCRGQCTHHKSMIPKLFRGNNKKYTASTLLDAQNTLMKKIKINFDMKRFQNKKLPALLQHYGIKTSWLDLVDNLYIAIWFATNSMKPGETKGSLVMKKSPNDYGWIYFITNSVLSNAELISVDLRTIHHSLSVRPHAQHGISVTKDSKLWNNKNRDLKDFVVATVRVPVSDKWHLCGYMASPDYLFPNSSIDNTLKILRQRKLIDIIDKVETKYKLTEGSLGSINWVN